MHNFKAKRRFDGDIGCKWEKDSPLNVLDSEFNHISEDCDFYCIRHWLLKCASAPYFETFFEKEDLKKYLEKNVYAGDALEIWAVNADKLHYAYVKMPDENGLIPIDGCAY